VNLIEESVHHVIFNFELRKLLLIIYLTAVAVRRGILLILLLLRRALVRRGVHVNRGAVGGPVLGGEAVGSRDELSDALVEHVGYSAVALATALAHLVQ